MIRGEREKNPVAMTIIKPLKVKGRTRIPLFSNPVCYILSLPVEIEMFENIVGREENGG